MKYLRLVLIIVALPICLQAQIKINSPYEKRQEQEKEKDKTYIPDEGQETANPANSTNVTDDIAMVKVMVSDLFVAMNQSDANKIKSLFAPEGRLMSTDASGKINILSVDQFAQMIGQAVKGSLEERVTDMEVKIDANLATVWAEYDFYHNRALQHCGVDAFQFYKGTSGWKIVQISDTRRKDCSSGGKTGAINSLIDQWHAAASKADAKTYFDLLSADGFYLGTDATENWDKSAFYQFAKPYFDKGNAWKFTPKDRKVYFSDDQQIAWFNELLDTWMGTCRGSGILKKQSDGSWKIMQYSLGMLVPNDLVQDYLKLLESRK